jgi:hypothetical protein
MHLHEVGHAQQPRDRRNVANEVETELVVQRCIGRVGNGDRKQRVPVWRGTNDRFGGNVAAGARPVLHDELLAKPLRQPVTDQARGDVVATAGSKTDDHVHRLRWIGWIGLCARAARRSRQSGRARYQVQKAAAGKLHDVSR